MTQWALANPYATAFLVFALILSMNQVLQAWAGAFAQRASGRKALEDRMSALERTVKTTFAENSRALTETTTATKHLRAALDSISSMLTLLKSAR